MICSPTFLFQRDSKARLICQLTRVRWRSSVFFPGLPVAIGLPGPVRSSAVPEPIATKDRRGVRVDNLLAVLVTVVREQQEVLGTLRTEVAALRNAAGRSA